MSLGLPDFGSHGRSAGESAVWRGVRVLGLLVLAYSAVIAAIEWRSASQARASLERARADVARLVRSADDERRMLRKNADLMIATASVESSPARVFKDLDPILPRGVTVSDIKIDYTQDAVAHLEMGVLASTPEAYDRFLGALGKSPLFSEIRPGSEVRPGLVRANVSAVHRPKKAER